MFIKFSIEKNGKMIKNCHLEIRMSVFLIKKGVFNILFQCSIC